MNEENYLMWLSRTLNCGLPKMWELIEYFGSAEEIYKAGKYLADAPLKRIPLFIRPGAVIPFNCYGDKASAALNKGNYENALLVTPPVYRRENDIYGFGESLCIVNEPNENGFELKS